MVNYLNYIPLIPPSDERDIALGHFMYEWGKLEMQLLYLFHLLSGTKWEIARIIFSTGFQSKSLSDILKAMGQVRLNKPEQITLNGLCRRYNEHAGKRNKIVHGLWDIEVDYKNAPFVQWARICYPTDPEKEKLIFDKHNQKQRRAYRFTIPQLEKASLYITEFTKDLREFTNFIMNQLLFEEQS